MTTITGNISNLPTIQLTSLSINRIIMNVTSTTYTSSGEHHNIKDEYIIIYYNKNNNKQCGYLSDNYELTKDIDKCKIIYGIEISENLVRDNIGKEYIDKIFSNKFYSFKYNKLYKDFFNGIKRNDIKLMAIKKDIEIRRTKLKKIKLKIN